MASIKNITIPDLGGAAEVTVIEILVKAGDHIEENTPIVTLESDKATMEVPSTDAGVVADIKVKLNDVLAAGDTILTLETSPAAETAASSSNQASSKSAAATSTKENSKADKTAAKKGQAQDTHTPKTEKISTKKDAANHAPQQDKAAEVLTGTLQTSDVYAGPGVRRLARELGVNLLSVLGSGPKRRILKEDVQAYVKSQLSQVQNNAGTGIAPMMPSLPVIDFSKFGAITTTPLSRIKKISGKNLQRNWMMIPHVTQFGDADITELEAFRQSKKDSLEKQGIKLTPLVFIMKAVVASLKAFPQFNASLDAAGENLVLKNYFNIGVAVDTPDGLVVPVVRDVDQKSLSELAKELSTLSDKARHKQLLPGDMQGGCFSISSLGGIGGTAFTPIINYPEVAILGVSKTTHKPVYQDGAFVPRLMLPLSLSYDHRVIDGADGARFMVNLTTMLSDIRNWLL